jgi:2,4-dienoyl-CoA reductase-like NADH-dependent reductase (Old Yellow Enzyme family)
LSILFTSKKIGPVEVKNRFVAASVYEAMATETGEVTDQLINKYRAIAKGGAGLVIPGAMHVSSLGRLEMTQTGIHEDSMIPGLTKLTETVHEHGSKIFLELAHSGALKEVIGQAPFAPSDRKADPIFRTRARE